MREEDVPREGLASRQQPRLAKHRRLETIVQWNYDLDIHFFRMSSDMFPWASEYSLLELPDYDAICALLARIGDLARRCNQRLTFHPSHFIVLASPNEKLVEKSIREMENHSKTLDLMGFEPSLGPN